ncbi:MAG: xylulokinase [Thermotogota bacterium]
MNYLGIDIGTSSIKSIVLNEKNEIVEQYSYPLEVINKKNNYSEQSPEKWLVGVKSCIKNIKSKIKSVSFSGQMHTLVPLDKNGDVIRDAILWNDGRSTNECKEATELLGGEESVLSITGNSLLEGFTLPKLLWIKNNEPENYNKIYKVLLPKDYIIYKLTGNIGIDYSDASGTSFLDIKNNKWSDDLLDKLKIPKEILPDIYNSNDFRGYLNYSKQKNVMVYSGGADNAISAFGNGVLETGDTIISLGTSGTVLAITEKKESDKKGQIHFFNHVIKDKKYYMGVMLSATSSLDWFLKNIGNDISLDDVEDIIKDIKPGNDKVIFLPYLNGERTPLKDPTARGVFFGIKNTTTKNDLLRSVIEGISFGIAQSYDLVKQKTDIKEIRITGGGSKNKEWVKIIASIIKEPIGIPKAENGGAFGAALMAKYSQKDITLPNIKDITGIKEYIYPDEYYSKVYNTLFPEYIKVTKNVMENFHSLNSLNF